MDEGYYTAKLWLADRRKWYAAHREQRNRRADTDLVSACARHGASTHQYLAFTFMNPAITDVSVRADSTAASADVADVWKSGKYIVVQYAGVQSTGTTLTFDGPKKEVKSITSSSGSANLYVTECDIQDH